MPFKISLPKSSLVEIESPTNTWNKLTEHNRGALEMSTERIEETKRMANGTLRKYKKADGTYEGPYTVIFSGFSPTIVKRGVDTFYNLSIEMQEV